MHRTIDDQPNARVPQGMLWLTAAVLLAAAGYYLGRGFYALTFSPDNFPIDLRLRWAEQRYIVRHGQDPFDLYFHNQPEGPVVPPRPITRNTTIDPDLGPVLQLAYPPPWTYALASLIWWPPWPQVCWWASLLDLLGLVLIAGWVYRTGRRAGRSEGVVVALISLACSNYFTVLLIGQLAIVILAFLVAALLLDRVGNDGFSGVMLGMAMIKPTIALPFFLIPLVRGRWASLAVGAAAGLDTAAVWARTGLSPVEMLQQMTAVAKQVEIPKGEPGPVTWLIGLGLSASAAVKAAMAAFLTSSAAAMWALRRRPVEVLYAVAAHRPTTGKALLEALPKSRRVG